ncbi:hypothetical protein mRhiFer1_001855 [Rhinolophus ferrumequinum]|uniref:Ciliary microtubule inner protein 2C n=1 Tax=Rhinolophus ferrumequinum TaxID=59479 RepID=A0A7J7V787_RHIFE|nr:hypothetical protein mRhiFer1_001855 [Rhinolophus ferrumequinum]
MASRSAGTLLTEFNAAYVPPALMPGYQGHVPGVAFSFGCPYGTATLKYFQDHRNAALEKGHTPFSKGGHFPTLFSANPNIMLSNRSRTRDRWLHTPTYTRFNLDNDRSTQLTCFYQPGRGCRCLRSLLHTNNLPSLLGSSCRWHRSIGSTIKTRRAWCSGSPISCCL